SLSSSLAARRECAPTTWNNFLERLPTLHSSRHHRRSHGISAGQLDRSSAHIGSAAGDRFARRLLEDVLDRDPVRRDPLFADLFLEPNYCLSKNISRRDSR